MTREQDELREIARHAQAQVRYMADRTAKVAQATHPSAQEILDVLEALVLRVGAVHKEPAPILPCELLVELEAARAMISRAKQQS